MRFSVLGSGSKGNCTLIESGSTAILVDAGFSGKEIVRRLGLLGRSAADLTAILITHEHLDHIQGAGVLSRQSGVPVYANPGTHQAADKITKLRQRAEFETGTAFAVGALEIHPFRISHDTADPVGFTVSDGCSALCCCTDTGKITSLIRRTASRCQALILEANYDPQLLADGPYPFPVKQRVRSSHGHLANGDAARFLAELAGSPLRQVVLAHLSSTNNLPELALARIQQEMGPASPGFSVDVALQEGPTKMFTL